MVDKRGTNPNSQANLSPYARSMGKKNFKVTLLPKTISWLKSRGNASSLIDYMVENAVKGLFTPDLLEKIEALRAENQSFKKRVQELYRLRVLSEKIEAKVSGYRSNSFSKGIEEFKEILKRIMNDE